ncbi:MAG: methyltransferase domain-containing protein [Planctomycetia bacterium]|nr:methyltransferase domain-containing protein [Planctomycetia bacterium]
MSLKKSPLSPDSSYSVKSRPKTPKILNEFVEHKLMNKVSYKEYRDAVRGKYDGPQGALLTTASFLSLHLALGDRLFRQRKFDLAGCKSILDVGSGAGQISKHLLKYADPDASITCFDISFEMLRRARNRLKSEIPCNLVADLTHLPFADGSFDCVTCGYVLEHLPDPRPGLAELARVMVPGGRMLLLATEDSFSGAFTSRFWCCRTYNRRDLHRVCEEMGLHWNRELWFTRMHKLLRAGGICVEMVRTANKAV